jgi:23S rRNA (cytidine1920-2'-O)/16S rRNA (cytidine1409-2'-O)-methyltransferase
VTAPGSKRRLDHLLVEKGLATSLEKAKALIYAGVVWVDRTPSDKPGKAVYAAALLEVKEPEYPYVSRGGVKLARALDHFNLAVEGKTALDVGASTGGFTHCLLFRGAVRVHAVDVGYGQLAWMLRQDPRVRVLERQNARYLTREAIGETVDLAVIDTSFISLKLIIPPLLAIVKPGGDILSLIKPQFEAGRGKVGKGGVIRNPEDREEVLRSLVTHFQAAGLAVAGPIESPITGAKGNHEYFIHLRKGEDPS